MKIVQLQFSNNSAGSSALRLHKAFIENGIDSTIVSLHPDNIADNKLKYLGKRARIIAKIDARIQKRLLKNSNEQLGLFSYPILGTDVHKMHEVAIADIIYLHWVLGGFLNLDSLDKLAKLGKPIIIIMHDMWYITGGCHYSFACNKYLIHCGSCPILNSNTEKDLSYKEFNKKINFYTRYCNIHFVSPSQWLYNCAKDSVLLRTKKIFYIPNAIDGKMFKPFKKSIAKNILNIDVNELVISFGAVKINSPYKGWSYLLQALIHLKEKNKYPNISVLIFGSGYNKEISELLPFKTRFLGYLKDEIAIVAAYNAANVFVVPSMADNQPTTIMESLCCGTAVVGFNVGGIPDMIEHKHNGYLAHYKDVEDLSNGIEFCLDNLIEGKILPSFERSEIIKKHKEMIEEVCTNSNNLK